MNDLCKRKRGRKPYLREVKINEYNNWSKILKKWMTQRKHKESNWETNEIIK